MLRAIGGFHSGLSDVSEHHDEYFAETLQDRE
jgi:hypothetical protein